MSKHDLYRATVKADEEFSAALERQFGNAAGDARYDATRWDAATRAACDRWDAAYREWRDAR